MLLFSKSKINIGLSILDKREDNYHNLETIFYPIPWEDALEIFPSKSFSLHHYGIPLNIKTEDNFIYKTWQYLKKNYDFLADKEVEIHHLKHIPHGAGLGGGSGNVATFINGIDKLFQCNFSIEEKKKIALAMGSDCPFFIEAVPSVGTGRGEILKKIVLNLQDYTCQVFYPPISINTGMAFKALSDIRKNKERRGIDYHSIPYLPIEEWKNHIQNDFLEVIKIEHPIIQDYLNQLYKDGALFADLSGSGPSFYAIFPKGQKATHAMFEPLNKISF